MISAKVQDPTGRWLSLDARFLKYQQRTIGWIYDAALRSRAHRTASASPGTPIEGGQADLTGIPEPVRDLFSQRSGQVEAKLADLIRPWSVEHDGADPDPRTIAGLERRRRARLPAGKAHGVDAAALHRTWADQARSRRASTSTTARDAAPTRRDPAGPRQRSRRATIVTEASAG